MNQSTMFRWNIVGITRPAVDYHCYHYCCLCVLLLLLFLSFTSISMIVRMLVDLL